MPASISFAVAQPSCEPIHSIIESQTSRGIQSEPVGFQITDVHIALVAFPDEGDTLPVCGWAQIEQGEACPVCKSPGSLEGRIVEESIYTTAWIDLENGPIVIESPPNTLGIIGDFWFRT